MKLSAEAREPERVSPAPQNSAGQALRLTPTHGYSRVAPEGLASVARETNSRRTSVQFIAVPEKRAVTLDRDVASALLVIVAIAPAAKGGAADAKRVVRFRNAFFGSMPTPRIAERVVRSNGRVCGVHASMTIQRAGYFENHALPSTARTPAKTCPRLFSLCP